MFKLLPKAGRKNRASKLQSIAIRDFGGGWNAVDNDIAMSSRYQVVVRNFNRTASSSLALRFGSGWFADVAGTVTGNIIDGWYFNNRIVLVTTTGQIATITDAGVVAKIWDSAIAALLPGAPSGWSAITRCDFVPFKDTLIIHNGTDKPVSISSAFAVTYLQDLATGSNTNVPVGKYGCVVSNYHVVAGIPAEPTTIYIASVGTAGVFPGDPAPNDSISLDVGAYAPEGGASIRGVAGFRSFLLVFFTSQTLIFSLGNYNEAGAHVPAANDSMPHFGLLGHRCITEDENDLLFADLDGLNSAKRNLFAGLVESTQLSDIVAPAYRGEFGGLSATEILDETFIVRDRLNNTTMVFSPDDRVFVYSSNAKLKFKSWSEYDGMGFTWACSTFLGRVFGGTGTRVYKFGNATFNEQYYADRVFDRDEVWATGTVYAEDDLVYVTAASKSYTCLVNHTSGGVSFAEDIAAHPDYWEEYRGEPITFEIEFPWLDGQDAMKLKQLRFMALQTKGSAVFTLEAFVDNLFKDEDGTEIYDPAVTVEFVGNDSEGFGSDSEGYGGGRRSADPRLQGFPVKFKTVKFRVTGESYRPLTIVSLNFLFARGGYKR